MWLATGCLLGGAFVGAVLTAWLMRRPIATTGAPTDPSAAVQVDTAQAQDAAEAKARTEARATAQGILRESDADTLARVERLRERGKSGE
jgi:hypothetical protein